MIQRILSTLALWTVIVLSLTYIGPQAGVWLIAILAMLTQRELYALLEKMGYRVHALYGMLWSPIIILGGYYLHYFFPHASNDAGADLFLLAVLLTLLATVRKNQIADQIQVMVPTLFGILYIPFLLYFFIRILFLDSYNTDTGILLAIWIVATAKFSDVGALLSGMAFGRHKLASNLSPKKTWEGVIGGIALSSLVGFLLPWIFSESFPAAFQPWLAALLAIPVAAMAVASDLIESVIKRVAGVKDSGQVIPGIGGAFDLTDSMILSAPVGYLLMKYFVFG